MPATALHAIAFGLLLQAAAIPAPAATAPAGTLPAVAATDDRVAPAAVASSMALQLDAAGRPEIEVTLDGKGPFHFTVDTAANASVLSPAVAERMHFRDGSSKRVTGGIGSASLRTVAIDRYRSGLFERRNETMALLPGLYTDGVVGMDSFRAGRLEFDLAARALRQGPSGATPEDFAALAGTLRQGILVVDVVIDGVHAKALVDTGAPYNIGNPRLQQALGLVPGDTRLVPGGKFADSFGQERLVEQSTLGQIGIGPVAFARPTVKFADMPVFRALGLDNGPALILGIDQLSHLGAIAIDFPRAELQLRP